MNVHECLSIFAFKISNYVCGKKIIKTQKGDFTLFKDFTKLTSFFTKSKM